MHNISYKTVCAPSEGSVISVLSVCLSVCLKTLGSLATHREPCDDSDQTARNAQAHLSIRWAHMRSSRKYCVPAHICKKVFKVKKNKLLFVSSVKKKKKSATEFIVKYYFLCKKQNVLFQILVFQYMCYILKMVKFKNRQI